MTLQILEEYLQQFKGCLIIVSHDRYFMDKVVDHLLVFEGDGRVKDYPGNYTQYRQWAAERERTAKSEAAEKNTGKSQAVVNKKEDVNERVKPRARKLTFKEKREYEQLEKDIEALEAEKAAINAALCGGTTNVDEITRLSKRLPTLNEELDEKEMRWLELSEVMRL